jgi:TetR/AcrR family transcriptional repressor of nem operon
MNHRTATTPATAERILDVAERLVQTRGFNGFSYADIAAELGITKASLHYHFATKAQLGCTLIERYTGAFEGALQKITTEQADARARLRAYIKIYADVLADGRMCLCGMAAAEYGTLPETMQKSLRVFFSFNERWLAQLLEQAQREGYLSLRAPASEEAGMLMSALEGAMLVARTMGDRARFGATAHALLAQLESRPPARARSASRARTAGSPTASRDARRPRAARGT